MKKLLQLSFVLITPLLMAQGLKLNQKEAFIPKQKHFSAISFQIEDALHLLVENAKENSSVHFYDALDGGKYIGHGTSDKMGGLAKVFKLENSPAFVLNNGYTTHLDEKEFMAKNIEWQRTNRGYELNFEVIANQNMPISYKLVRIDEQDRVHILKENLLQETWELQSIDLPVHTKSSYELRFYNDKQLRYSQVLGLDELEDAYSLYPSIGSSEINIDFLAAFLSGEYSLLNSNGQLVYRESLSGQFNSIDISKLPAGNYFIDVKYNGERLASKAFVKR